MTLFTRIVTFLLFVTVCAIAVFSGCSDDSSPAEPEKPKSISVSIAPTAMSVGITETRSIGATVTGGAANAVEWYVADVLGGNTAVGTITQTNPATYTAPDQRILSGPVAIKAVSTEDTTRLDSCLVTVTFNTVYVDKSSGHDTTGVGGLNKPYKSITKALSIAGDEQTVLVAPGVYDVYNGESFPIRIRNSVVVEGVDWEACVIQVDAESLDVRNAVVMECVDCGLRKFTLEEKDTQNDYWTNAVQLSGCVNAWADSLRCLERALYAVMRVQYDSQSTVENCYFVVDDGTKNERGLEIVFNDDGNGTILRNLTVSGYHTGIEFNYMQNTLVENCMLSGNVLGANLCCHLDANSQPNPDFGGGARGSAGGNNFTGNTGCGLQNGTANVIYAKFNAWENAPPIEGSDYCNQDTANGGDVITQ